MKIWWMLLLFLLTAAGCSPESQEAADSENNTVELIFGDQEESFSASYYAEMTEEALDIFESRTYYPGSGDVDDTDLERWFIRYYIQMHEYNENWSVNELMQLAEERVRFEEEWRSLASSRYDIEVDEEDVEEQADYNVELFETNTPASVSGIAEGRGMTIEEFFHEFDRDHAERTVLWERLYPVLQEEYASDEENNTVSLAQRYTEDVLTSMQQEEAVPTLPSLP
ncbi:hypothetical protein [Alkalicoccus chagannorensis]|uniref:hypothetical protein n=1 Tax=Alkalicoccus chagannorensis TaxID=427072 RepID=UPI0012EC8E07|nr:hypothetical protein [Alkalicoccus chagannorensis]